MNETLRQRRGHKFCDYTGIPGLYETEDTSLDEKVIYAHYFCANADWWVAEVDPRTNTAFGYVRFMDYPDGAEWGYFSLAELESVNFGLVIVERDLDWEPTPFGQVTT